MTAICRSRPWKHKLGICRTSTCNYEASAPTISANGGRRQCGHGDGASRRNTGEPVSGAAALPSATSEQRRRGDVVGSRRSYGRDGGGARCAPAGNGNGGTAAAAALLAAGERGGEGEGRKCKWSAGVHGRALGLDVAHDSPSWPGRAAKRRRAAPRGVEALKMVGYCSTSSEPRFQPDSDTRRR